MNDLRGIPMVLGPRLAAVANLVEQGLACSLQERNVDAGAGAGTGTGTGTGVTLADIGSDHAYLPVVLLRQGVVDRAIATDTHEGPYQNILRTIEHSGLEGPLSARLGDGLAGFRPGDVHVIVMAGMGGALIEKILRAGEAVVKEVSCLVLQPQNACERVCRMLLAAGWRLAGERLAAEGREIYRVMSWIRGCGKEPVCGWDKAEIERCLARWREEACPSAGTEVFARCVWRLGPGNIARRDELLRELADRELARLARAREGLALSDRKESRRKGETIAAEVHIWEDVLKWLFP